LEALGVKALTDAAGFLYTYFMSLLPSFEGRYAVVAGRALGLDALYSFLASLLGVFTLSCILPYLLLFIDDVMTMFSRSSFRTLRIIGDLYLHYVNRAREKASAYIDKYGFIGLVVFVAIPLPGTGIWTGSLAAYILGMARNKTIIALVIGGIISLLLMFIPTYMVL